MNLYNVITKQNQTIGGPGVARTIAFDGVVEDEESEIYEAPNIIGNEDSAVYDDGGNDETFDKAGHNESLNFSQAQ